MLPISCRLPIFLEAVTNPAGNSLSVLVIDKEPEILSFLARILDSNGIRALLARDAGEAIGIAKRSYLPIDLVLTDVLLRPDATAPEIGSGPELVDRLRQMRPLLRSLYMSAHLDRDVIRIELLDRGLCHTSKSSDHRGLIESIRAAAARPIQRAHGLGGG
jgi:CheY-like chemotaxis protein